MKVLEDDEERAQRQRADFNCGHFGIKKDIVMFKITTLLRRTRRRIRLGTGRGKTLILCMESLDVPSEEMGVNYMCSPKLSFPKLGPWEVQTMGDGLGVEEINLRASSS